MAKKKQKKKENNSGFKYPIEIKGIVFIVVAIIGFLGFKANILGTIIKGFAMFLMGSFDFIVLLIMLISGFYMLVKRENPKYFSSRMIGIYIFLVGLLSLAHLNYLDVNSTFFDTMKNTIDEVIKCINTKVSFAGGGVIGAFFISIFYYLLGKMGSIIVISVLMLIGVILVSDLSISDAISKIREKLKRKKETSNEEDDEYENEEDGEDYDEETGEVIDKKAKRKAEKEKIKLAKAKRLSYIEEDDEEEEGEEEVIPKKQEEKKEETPASNKYLNYVLPDLSILDAGDNNSKKKGQAKNEAMILDNAKRLDGVLRDFGITAKVKTAHVGPSITQYELEVKSGTKISKIKALSSEIALALAATDVRIQAPIPGKSTVGVELPNKISTGVSFYEMMQELLKENSDNKLRVALGKDIMGQPIFMDINKTPHLLIAGSTGSGKSVCVNCIISSILMRAKPDEVKLIMVDPKKVELTMYNCIPHLLMPVITDPKKASAALQKVVDEMEKRYELFSDSKTKNIEGYNAKLRAQNELLPVESQKPLLPYIVVLIDELADLMLVASKEVEQSIMRITQMARAAGIHLIVATQRPSTDVITGVVKANIPSRISFAVSSQIDSRTILDHPGAEKLLGKGDMLYAPMGATSPTRIQGAFISEEDVEKIANKTIEQQKAVYDENFMKLDEVGSKTSIDKDDVDNDDPLYNDIVEFVISTRKASASLLQRRFKLGYNRAARIIDLLEERGIIGPANGSKPREVLVDNDEEDEE
jgi:S-DNA-T family DNA segregation ATPase FtsK/SpoIIIE